MLSCRYTIICSILSYSYMFMFLYFSHYECIFVWISDYFLRKRIVIFSVITDPNYNSLKGSKDIFSCGQKSTCVAVSGHLSNHLPNPGPGTFHNFVPLFWIGIIISGLCIWSPFTFAATLGGGSHYYFHSADEEAEAWWGTLPKIA